MDYDSYFARISRDTNGRYDVTRLFEEHHMLATIVEDFAAPFRDDHIDAVAGIEALGFVLGTGVALDLSAGFVPIRKGGNSLSLMVTASKRT